MTVDRYYYMALGMKSFLAFQTDQADAVEIVAEVLREIAGCPSGGMADTADLKSAEETRAGSTPASGTTSIEHSIRALTLNPREALYLINQLIERVRP